MIRVHFLDGASGTAVRSFSASALAVTDLVGARTLTPLGSNPTTQAAGTAGAGDTGTAAGDEVAIELAAGTEIGGAAGPGTYRIEGLAPAEAERELLTEPGETGG